MSTFKERKGKENLGEWSVTVETTPKKALMKQQNLGNRNHGNDHNGKKNLGEWSVVVETTPKKPLAKQQNTRNVQGKPKEMASRWAVVASTQAKGGTTGQDPAKWNQVNNKKQDKRNEENKRKPANTVLLETSKNHGDLDELKRLCQQHKSPMQQLLRKSEIKGKIEVANKTLCFQSDRPISYRDQESLRRLFRQTSKDGFREWLGGQKGWRYEESSSGPDMFNWKKDFVIVFNCLQEVFKLLAPKDQLYMPDSNNELVWKKQTNLKACVADIRVWLETLPRNQVIDALFSTSNDGPAAPLHWAHHHPKSTRYPRTVVTRSSMTQLVNGILHAFRREFSTGKQESKLGTFWFQEQKKKRQSEWKATTDIDWCKEKMKSLLNKEESFKFA